MNRASANFLVDLLAFAAFVFLTATGVLMRFVLPPGSGHFSTLWGLDRHQWGTIHLWIAVAMLCALAVHLSLHWRWIVCLVKGRPRQGSGIRVGLAIMGLVALVALAVSPFLAGVEQTGTSPHKLRAIEPSGTDELEIRGSMTLLELEKLTGVPVREILQGLNLPPDVPADEQLGKLRRLYGFEIDDVRKIIRERSPER